MLSIANDGESRSSRHFNDSSVSLKSPLSFDRFAKWSRDNGFTVGTTEDIQGSLTTISEGHFVAFNSKFPAGVTDGTRHIFGTCGSFKFVHSSQNSHRSSLSPL
jgi:TolB-like protein